MPTPALTSRWPGPPESSSSSSSRELSECDGRGSIQSPQVLSPLDKNSFSGLFTGWTCFKFQKFWETFHRVSYWYDVVLNHTEKKTNLGFFSTKTTAVILHHTMPCASSPPTPVHPSHVAEWDGGVVWKEKKKNSKMCERNRQKRCEAVTSSGCTQRGKTGDERGCKITWWTRMGEKNNNKRGMSGVSWAEVTCRVKLIAGDGGFVTFGFLVWGVVFTENAAGSGRRESPRNKGIR